MTHNASFHLHDTQRKAQDTHSSTPEYTVPFPTQSKLHRQPHLTLPRQLPPGGLFTNGHVHDTVHMSTQDVVWPAP
ncbi:hypothetical protein IF1G_10428 [Cordyceps javanica]|uniref:Uncharacterized protein n=1 Tax=Cordyceps javanica TaxID=43265 RepID=A0A545UN62_9HYPO|nr:hypothetical protein IF1G_10428 [Cordyceps javanica]